MNRQERRKEQRLDNKIENKMYTAKECRTMLINALTEHNSLVQSKYEKQYTLCLAAALSAPPLNFGRKRACDFMTLFFDQIECINNGNVTYEEMETEARKLGVTITYEDNKFVVNINANKKGG